MTSIEYKGKKYELRTIKFGKWREILRLRKEAIESKDEQLIAEALAKWLQAAFVMSDEELNDLDGYADAMALLQKASEAQALPLPQGASSAEPLSQEIRV